MVQSQVFRKRPKYKAQKSGLRGEFGSRREVEVARRVCLCAVRPWVVDGRYKYVGVRKKIVQREDALEATQKGANG